MLVLEVCVAVCDTVFIINKEWMLQNKLNCCRWFCFSAISLDQQRNWTYFSCLLLWIFSLKSKTSKIIYVSLITQNMPTCYICWLFSRNAWLHDVSDHNFLQLYELTGVPSGSLCYNNWLKSEFEIISQMWNQIKQNQHIYMMLKKVNILSLNSFHLRSFDFQWQTFFPFTPNSHSTIDNSNHLFHSQVLLFPIITFIVTMFDFKYLNGWFQY